MTALSLHADLSNETFRFTTAGSGPARYTVFNYQKVDGYDQYEWIPVGSYFSKSPSRCLANLSSPHAQEIP